MPFAKIGTPRFAKLGDKRRSCAAIPKGLVPVVCSVPTNGKKGDKKFRVLGYGWSKTRIGTAFSRHQLAFLRGQSGFTRAARVLAWAIEQQKLAARGLIASKAAAAA